MPELLVKIKKYVAAEVDAAANALVAGHFQTFDEVKYAQGKHAAYRDVLSEIEQIEKKALENDR